MHNSTQFKDADCIMFWKLNQRRFQKALRVTDGVRRSVTKLSSCCRHKQHFCFSLLFLFFSPLTIFLPLPSPFLDYLSISIYHKGCIVQPSWIPRLMRMFFVNNGKNLSDVQIVPRIKGYSEGCCYNLQAWFSRLTCWQNIISSLDSQGTRCGIRGDENCGRKGRLRHRLARGIQRLWHYLLIPSKETTSGH